MRNLRTVLVLSVSVAFFGCAEKEHAPPPQAAVAPTPPPAPVALPPAPGRTNTAGVALIKESEGLRLDAYQDGGQWLIGYGHLITDKPGTRITEAEAEQLLKDDLGVCEHAIGDAVKVPVSINEFSAMASLCYSIGWQRFADSTVIKKLNAADRSGAADGFLLWTKITVDGARKVDPRLETRRQKEKTLFLAP